MFGNDREMKRHCGFVGKRAAVRRGFTLIEAMLAGAILAIGCLGVLGILIAVIQQNDVSQRRTEGMYVAELLLNRLETMDATKQTGSPLSDIKSASASRWFALEQNSTVGNRYTANGDVNGSGDYIAHYMVLPSSATGTTNSVIDSGAFVRGALRVSWRRPTGGGDCTFNEGTPSENCDSVSLPFVFARDDDASLPGA